MREILFRGKRTDNGEWSYGSLLGIDWCDKPSTYSIAPNTPVSVFYPVIPETVGQYTGLTDKNGKKIFEGDIIKSCEYDDIYAVKYFDSADYPAFDCVPEVINCDCNGLSCLINVESCEVIGNIHDNRELLGNAENP